MKNNCFLKNSKSDVFNLQISLMSGLMEDSWILTDISAFSLLKYVVLFECVKKTTDRWLGVLKSLFSSLKVFCFNITTKLKK